MKYSVLTYNINGYEVLHEIPEKIINETPDVEYVYVTDDRSITSNTWKVKYVDLEGDTFDKCYQIRFNPFNFVSNDIMVRIDGSMCLRKSLDPLVKYFDKNEYDIAIMIHPTRATMLPEYQAWVSFRGYPAEQANKVLKYMQEHGYDVQNHKGLYQYNFMIQRNNEINDELNKETFRVLKELAKEGDTIERIDQTVGSMVLNQKFADKMDIMTVGQNICSKKSFFIWYAHNSNIELRCDGVFAKPYVNNKIIPLAPIW